MLFNLSNKSYKEEICNNPDHIHFGNKLYLFELQYNNHYIEVTQDRNLFHVRIDKNLEKLECSYSEMVDFVETETRRLENEK